VVETVSPWSLGSPYPGNLDPRLARQFLSSCSLIFPVEVTSVLLLLLLLLLYTVIYDNSALTSFILAVDNDFLWVTCKTEYFLGVTDTRVFRTTLSCISLYFSDRAS
jgi:hypothetical protein